MNKHSTRPLRRYSLHLGLATVCLFLIPHQASSVYTINEGLSVGYNNYNAVSSNTSAAIGVANTVAGDVSLAIGGYNKILSGSYAGMIVGFVNTISGTSSAIIGDDNIMSGTGSLAVGGGHLVNGLASLAFGNNNQITTDGHAAAAGGLSTIANARAAMALGNYTTANTFGSLVIGQYNAALPGETDAAAKTTWRGDDPLFIIGNGTSSSQANRKNALVVQKNGTVSVTNKLILSANPPAGDIPMYQP